MGCGIYTGCAVSGLGLEFRFWINLCLCLVRCLFYFYSLSYWVSELRLYVRLLVASPTYTAYKSTIFCKHQHFPSPTSILKNLIS